MEQQTIFSVPQIKYAQAAKRAKRIRASWELCWGWPGPEAGQPLQVHNLTAVDVNGCEAYWYCTRCIAVQELPGGCWLVRVEYKSDAPEHCRMKNGTLLVLAPDDIWPPVDDLREA